MNQNKPRERVILIYFLGLIMLVISNMLREVTILDVIYLIALISAVCKYFMIMREIRK